MLTNSTSKISIEPGGIDGGDSTSYASFGGMKSWYFAPGFMIKLQQKDLRLALAAAADAGAPTPITRVVHELFAAVEAHDGGDLGTQAILTALEALSTARD